MTKAFSTQVRFARPGAWLAAAGGLALAAAAAAQPDIPVDRDHNPILVQGERLSRPAAEARAAGFIRTTGVASGEVPTARWVDPICPDVTGLVDNANRYAEQRIRRVAEAAGVPVAPDHCVRNIAISFAPDGAAMARAIGQREGRRLSELSPSAREAVLNGTAPIRWMYTTEVRSGDGRQEALAASGATTPQQHAGTGAGSGLPGPGGLMLYDSSIVSTLSQRVIVSAIVIIDQNQVMGRRLDSLADYAALVALAEIRAAGATPQGSILAMFTAPDAPRSLTAQDAAFLRALYRLSLDRQAIQHRGVLVDQIADALTGNP